MKLKDLREALAQIGTGHDHKDVVISLPLPKGSRVDLQNTLMLRDGEIVIEGTVRRFSLDTTA